MFNDIRLVKTEVDAIGFADVVVFVRVYGVSGVFQEHQGSFVVRLETSWVSFIESIDLLFEGLSLFGRGVVIGLKDMGLIKVCEEFNVIHGFFFWLF